MKKYSILMFNFGDYEIMREPIEMDEDCEYVYVTDNVNLKSNKWTMIYTDRFKHNDAVYAAFYVRYHPFEFVNTDVCFIIDGSIQIKKSLRELYERFQNSDTDMMLSCNCFGHTLGNEIDWWVKNRNMKMECAEKMKWFLTYHKLNDFRGCFEIGFRCVKRNDYTTSVNNCVWKHLLFLSVNDIIPRTDQTIFGAVLAAFYSDAKVFKVTRQIIQNSYLRYCVHKSKKEIDIPVRYDNIYYMNKKTSVETLGE